MKNPDIVQKNNSRYAAYIGSREVKKIKFEINERYEVTTKTKVPTKGIIETKKEGIITGIYPTYAIIDYGTHRGTLSTIPDFQNQKIRKIDPFVCAKCGRKKKTDKGELCRACASEPNLALGRTNKRKKSRVKRFF